MSTGALLAPGARCSAAIGTRKTRAARLMAPRLSAALGQPVIVDLTGIDMSVVLYRGTPPAVTELVGGRGHVMVTTTSDMMPFVRLGKLRALDARLRDGAVAEREPCRVIRQCLHLLHEHANAAVAGIEAHFHRILARPPADCVMSNTA